MTIDWLDIGKIVLFSSFGAAFVNFTLNHLFVYRASLSRDARYTALRAALILETFTLDCSETLVDDQEHVSSRGHGGTEMSSLPKLTAFPSDAEWKAITVELTDRALSMPIEIIQAERQISNVSEWGDGDDMIVEMRRQTRILGLRSWRLAVDLRKRHKLPPSFSTKGNWDFLTILEKQSKANGTV